MSLCSHVIELIPVGQIALNLGRVIGAKNILCDTATVCEQARSRLPGGATLAAVHRNDVFGILILVGEVLVGQPDILFDIQSITGINVLQCIVGFNQEDVDLVIIGSGILAQQSLIQLVLVVVVGVGVDRPFYNCAVLQGSGGLVGSDFGNFWIVVVEAALKLIVPAPDVQHLTSGGASGSCGRTSSRAGTAPGRTATAGRQSSTDGHGTGSQQEISTRNLFHGQVLLHLLSDTHSLLRSWRNL